MTEADARRLLLMQAFETTPGAAWSEADRAWADREAAREPPPGADAGADAKAEAVLLRRATLVGTRLEREAGVSAAMALAAGPPSWLAVVLLIAAFAAGFASDALVSHGRIYLIAPALVALLLWNLAVYLALAIGALRQRDGDGPLRRAVRQLLWKASAARKWRSPALLRFAGDWAAASAALQTARLAAVLHGAALAWALGALASVYLHGLFFEYRAGWSSTFIQDAGTLRSLLALLLWPATALGGVTLPGADELARLNFSFGPGENAARWIHWYALTIALVVLLPRVLLALREAWRARRMAARFALPLNVPYFQRLLRGHAGKAARARLLPYSYQLAPQLQPALRELLERALGPQLQLRAEPPVAQGAEDEACRWLAAPAADETLVLLFALTATPEAETHGDFLRKVAAHQPASARRLVLIDESGFRARFADDARLAQRRAAWQRLLAEHGEQPVFVDLARPASFEAACAPT